MQSFQLNATGVYLEPDMTQAAAHSKQLGGCKVAMGLVSIAPLQGARSSQRITFVLKRMKDGQAISSQVAEGFLNQYGPVEVRHTMPSQSLSLNLTKHEAATMVVAVQAKKSTVGPTEWAAMQQCATVADVKKALVEKAQSLPLKMSLSCRGHRMQYPSWCASSVRCSALGS